MFISTVSLEMRHLIGEVGLTIITPVFLGAFGMYIGYRLGNALTRSSVGALVGCFLVGLVFVVVSAIVFGAVADTIIAEREARQAASCIGLGCAPLE